MGGNYYDRQVISPTEGLYGNDLMDKQTELQPVLDPKQRKIDITTDALNPIVFGLDVTGSMGVWSKIIFDKLPMFFGQIKMNEYLKDPALSFCAIGDATADKAPFQVTAFGKGKQLDQYLKKIYIQKGGGGTNQQSYELAAYFYNRRVQLSNKQKAYFFIVGDEDYYKIVNPKVYQYILGVKIQQTIEGQKQFNLLKQKYEVFLLRKTYVDKDEQIQASWCKTLGSQKVMLVNSPKACIDVILGILALSQCKRNLEDYLYDMDQRGQSKQRIEQVKQILNIYSNFLQNNGHFKQYKPLNRPPIIKPQQNIVSQLETKQQNVPQKIQESVLPIKEQNEKQQTKKQQTKKQETEKQLKNSKQIEKSDVALIQKQQQQQNNDKSFLNILVKSKDSLQLLTNSNTNVINNQSQNNQNISNSESPNPTNVTTNPVQNIQQNPTLNVNVTNTQNIPKDIISDFKQEPNQNQQKTTKQQQSKQKPQLPNTNQPLTNKQQQHINDKNKLQLSQTNNQLKQDILKNSQQEKKIIIKSQSIPTSIQKKQIDQSVFKINSGPRPKKTNKK